MTKPFNAPVNLCLGVCTLLIWAQLTVAQSPPYLGCGWTETVAECPSATEVLCIDNCGPVGTQNYCENNYQNVRALPIVAFVQAGVGQNGHEYEVGDVQLCIDRNDCWTDTSDFCYDGETVVGYVCKPGAPADAEPGDVIGKPTKQLDKFGNPKVCQGIV